MAMMILYTDKELIDLVVELSNEVDIPSESNLLSEAREELLQSLTKPAPDAGKAAASQAFSTPETLF